MEGMLNGRSFSRFRSVDVGCVSFRLTLLSANGYIKTVFFIINLGSDLLSLYWLMYCDQAAILLMRTAVERASRVKRSTVLKLKRCL